MKSSKDLLYKKCKVTIYVKFYKNILTNWFPTELSPHHRLRRLHWGNHHRWRNKDAARRRQTRRAADVREHRVRSSAGLPAGMQDDRHVGRQHHRPIQSHPEARRHWVQQRWSLCKLYSRLFECRVWNLGILLFYVKTVNCYKKLNLIFIS